jgi:hypothetical protein
VIPDLADFSPREECRVCHTRGAAGMVFRRFERKSVFGEVPLRPWGFAVLLVCDRAKCAVKALSQLTH